MRNPTRSSASCSTAAFRAAATFTASAARCLQHDTFAFGLFSSLWKEVGGSFAGKLRKTRIPPETTPALVWQSKPLGEIVRSINKNSNNVMTRQLLYTLGAEAAGAPGTRENGVAAVRTLLAARGLDTSTLMLQNGAGLSRDERASMQFLVDLLRVAYRSPYAPEFIASLSLGGLDGTTRGRFDASPASGVMHLKTGRLGSRVGGRGVRARREREDLRRRRRHEHARSASRAGAGARGSRAAVHPRAALEALIGNQHPTGSNASLTESISVTSKSRFVGASKKWSSDALFRNCADSSIRESR